MNFDDIRPYHDDEVSAVVQRVLADHEFIDLITGFRFPRFSQFLRGPLRLLMRPLVRSWFAKRFAGMQSVAELQASVESYMTLMIDNSTDGFAVRGLEHVDLAEPHLFISNHRDITLDPAFTNYALHRAGGSTVRIAIGDNLLSKPYASDLMRLNKSFIVRRNISKPRELLKALSHLSKYILHSLTQDRHPVWIAQREGRAKDGIDVTDAAVIKMIFLAKPKAQPFAEYLQQLRIVPVSIAYEYDPCLALKTRELHLRATTADYVKQEHEDLESIGQGISGHKGRVTLSFAPVINGCDSIDSLVEALDTAIICNYQLYPNNWLAYARTHGLATAREALGRIQQSTMALSALGDAAAVNAVNAALEDASPEQGAFAAHIAQLPEPEQAIAVACYANPIDSLLAQLDKLATSNDAVG